MLFPLCLVVAEDGKLKLFAAAFFAWIYHRNLDMANVLFKNKYCLY
jgi:hypothetical protein